MRVHVESRRTTRRPRQGRRGTLPLVAGLTSPVDSLLLPDLNVELTRVRVERYSTRRRIKRFGEKEQTRRVSLETERSLPEAIAPGSGAREEYLCSPDVGVSAREVPETARGSRRRVRNQKARESFLLTCTCSRRRCTFYSRARFFSANGLRCDTSRRSLSILP